MRFLLLSLCLALLAGAAAAQTDGKKPASPRLADKGKIGTVEWGAPSKKGRDIFGALVPYGKVWRTGANECSEIEFKKNVTFGGQRVKAGRYALFTIPGENEWTIILNSEVGQWGAFNYNPDKDVARITVPATKTNEVIEVLTLDFKKDNKKREKLVLSWDNTAVEVPIAY